MPIQNIPLTIKNYSVSDEDKSSAAWLLKKYTSHAWAKRTVDILDIFIKEYRKFATKKDHPKWARETLSGLELSSFSYREGLKYFENGDFAKGCVKVFGGALFSEWLEDPRSELADRHIDLGYRAPPGTPVGAYVFADLAFKMAFMTRATYQALHSFPDILTDANFPPEIETLRDPLFPISKDVIRYGHEYPVSGIWLPINHPFGCPQYLKAGMKGMRISVPTTENREWDYQDEMDKGLPPKRTLIFQKEIEPDFVLLWKEDRYSRGRIPDESEYLDPPVDIPDMP